MLHLWVSCGPNQDDPILGQPDRFCHFPRRCQTGHMRGYSFRSGISDLKGEFFCSVSGVCRRDDSAGPKTAPYDGRIVDGVGTVKSEDVALLPIPVCLETFAKFNGRTADLCIRVRATGLRVDKDYCDN
jgi:hypothetical protein